MSCVIDLGILLPPQLHRGHPDLSDCRRLRYRLPDSPWHRSDTLGSGLAQLRQARQGHGSGGSQCSRPSEAQQARSAEPWAELHPLSPSGVLSQRTCPASLPRARRATGRWLPSPVGGDRAGHGSQPSCSRALRPCRPDRNRSSLERSGHPHGGSSWDGAALATGIRPAGLPGLIRGRRSSRLCVAYLNGSGPGKACTAMSRGSS